MKEHTKWLRQRAAARRLMRIAMWLVAISVILFAVNFFHSTRFVKGLGFLLLSFSLTCLRVSFVEHIKLYEDFCKKAILPFAHSLQKELPSFAVYVPRLRAVFFAKDFRALEESFRRELRDRFFAHKRHVAAVARLQRAASQRATLKLSHAELDLKLIDLAILYGKATASGNMAYRAIGHGKLGEKRRLAQMLSSRKPEEERQQGVKADRFMAQFRSMAAKGADKTALSRFMSATETLDMDERLELLKQAIDLQRTANQRNGALPKAPSSKPKRSPRPAPDRHVDLYTEFVRKVPVCELLAGSGLNLNMASELLFRLAKDRVFGEKYKQLDDIRGDIARSFRQTHSQNFNPRDFKKLLAWLVKQGVVLEWKNGQTISLSPHASTGTTVLCRDLIVALVRFDREFH